MILAPFFSTALWRIGVFLLFLLCGTLLYGQPADLNKPWMLGSGITFYDLASASGTGVGPSVVVSRRFDEHFGIEFTPTIILQSNGFRTFLGIAGDVGAIVSWRPPHSEFIISTGISALNGVDGSGGVLGRGGVYARGKAQLWLSEALGLYGQGTARIWLVGHISEERYGRGGPSAGGGIVFRF